MQQAADDSGTPVPITREASGTRFVLLVAAQAFVAFVAHFVVVLGHFAFDGCEPRPSTKRCDYALGGNADTVMATVIAAGFAVTLICALILRLRHRPVWWSPLAGSAVVILGCVASLILIQVATAR